MKLTNVTLPANGAVTKLVPPIGVRFLLIQPPSAGDCRISFVGDHPDCETLGLPFNELSAPITAVGDTHLFLGGIYASAQGGAACQVTVQYF